jgi:hypothetical protein
VQAPVYAPLAPPQPPDDQDPTFARVTGYSVKEPPGSFILVRRKDGQVGDGEVFLSLAMDPNVQEESLRRLLDQALGEALQ